MRAPARTICPCDQSELERVHRTWWMRLTSSKRLYECRGCGVRLFIPKQAVERIPRQPAAHAVAARGSASDTAPASGPSQLAP